MKATKRRIRALIVCSLAGALGLTPAVAVHNVFAKDFGRFVEQKLKRRSKQLFGIKKPLEESAPPSTVPFRNPSQTAEDQVLLAKGLRVEYLTREAAELTDMMASWPNDYQPTHLITCVEQRRKVIGTLPNGSIKYNPSVQRINLQTGRVETVLRGMSRCDGIRRTPWGTILATEEVTTGAAYEILNPLTITNETVLDRGLPGTAATITTSKVVKRTALPTMAWEGIAILESGVVIGGDELRPGDLGQDVDGGAIFKFIPDIPRTDNSRISDLNQSPLVSGRVFAMTISCRESSNSRFPQFGQGCEVGEGAWVEVNAATARSDANARGATGYYRPEDLHRDPLFDADGVRFCWTNTGRKRAAHFAEVMCAVDATPLPTDPVTVEHLGKDGNVDRVDPRQDEPLQYLADAARGNELATVIANRFVEGDRDFNAYDNLAFQPVTGNLYVIEDDKNGDIFACLPDGGDRDIKTDGCVKVISVKDSSAEPTGFLFIADGTTAFVSIAHSNDTLMPLVDNSRTDDVLVITGFGGDDDDDDDDDDD